MDLSKNELEWLAGHMGHNLDVHFQYYRLQDSAIELAKISKQLIAVDEGSRKDLMGKKLDDIELDCMFIIFISLFILSIFDKSTQ